MCQTVEVHLHEHRCLKCGYSWWWPEKLELRRQIDGLAFFCPYCGHKQWYQIGKSKEKELQERLAAAQEDNQQLVACCNNLEVQVMAKDRSIRGYKGVVGRMRNKLGRRDRRH